MSLELKVIVYVPDINLQLTAKAQLATYERNTFSLNPWKLYYTRVLKCVFE